MTGERTTSGPARQRRRGAWLLSWLAGRSRGRWATVKGRWIQTILMVVLLITGLSAWALALVQPWTRRRGDPGLVELPAFGLDPEKVRGASRESENLVERWQAPAPKPLARDPFASTDGAAEARRPPEAEPPSPDATGLGRTESAMTPRQVLAALRTLRLEATVVDEEGERWAVINGQDCREGDTVAGLRLVEIQESKVKLRQAGTTCLLRMD